MHSSNNQETRFEVPARARKEDTQSFPEESSEPDVESGPLELDDCFPDIQ